MTAHIMVPSLGIRGSVSFLLDTGADQTVLMPTDAIRLGVDTSKLTTPATTYGVGGRSDDFQEKALILFSDGVLHVYEVDLILMQSRPALVNAPSLLGRNIINRWRVTFDYPGNIVAAEIVSSDRQIPIPSG
ncbi:retroviral-like aspartic protease family protein [Propylenella binzhouense]|nr:retroviral-like aspartic protease family protein [Propylenella binzhouense]